MVPCGMSSIFPGFRLRRRYPLPTEWFNVPVEGAGGSLGTPNTPTASAMARYGQIHIARNCVIKSIHLHQIADGASNSSDIEIYRWRNGAFTEIAQVSLAAGGGDFGLAEFTFVSDSHKEMLAGDYLYMQSTAAMAGSDRGFVDVHFEPVPY